MRLFPVLSAVILVVCVATSGDASNSTWGYIGPYDRLLRREYVVHGSRWLQVVTAHVSYPPKGYVSYYNISGIRAIDWDRKNGGFATLCQGGPGFRNATIHLKSQRGYGLNFTVEFFARH